MLARSHVASIDVILGVSRNVRVSRTPSQSSFLSRLSTFCMIDRFVRPSAEEIKSVPSPPLDFSRDSLILAIQQCLHQALQIDLDIV